MTARATPYTPETLADRWQCSPRHVRNMIRDGRLLGFRLGGKLLRIRAGDVEEFEQCQDTDLDDTGDNGQQSAEQEQAESVVRLARIERRQTEPSTA